MASLSTVPRTCPTYPALHRSCRDRRRNDKAQDASQYSASVSTYLPEERLRQEEWLADPTDPPIPPAS